MSADSIMTGFRFSFNKMCLTNENIFRSGR